MARKALPCAMRVACGLIFSGDQYNIYCPNLVVFLFLHKLFKNRFNFMLHTRTQFIIFE